MNQFSGEFLERHTRFDMAGLKASAPASNELHPIILPIILYYPSREGFTAPQCVFSLILSDDRRTMLAAFPLPARAGKNEDSKSISREGR